ncbi:MAG: restriction endonuclease [Blastocatellia bacterium]|nr:restriction endonuclease [Blastocatellia bacterium]
MNYTERIFKVPEESDDYAESSAFAIHSIEKIIENAILRGENKIIINTNLKLGLPMENINKIAGPFVEAWACETFVNIVENPNNEWNLINVEALERLNRADVLLQFKRNKVVNPVVTAEVDVKATSEDFESSGKSPNITSYARIRTAYVIDPDYLFVILSLKHKVYSQRNFETGLMDGIMEVVKYNAYDIKYLSDSDISYNPALGTGQIQIRDIHYVTTVKRTAWEFCQMLDRKYLASSRRSFENWLALATKYGWIK